MSLRAMTLVFERARAKGSNLLALLAIADTEQDGVAFPTAQTLAKKCRLTDRGVRLVLHKLQADGELGIELNTTHQTLELRDGRRIEPPWFLHIRCIGDWPAYGEKPEKISDSPSGPFPPGRPPKPQRKSEKISDSSSRSGRRKPERAFRETGMGVPRNRKNPVRIKRNERSFELSLEQVQGDEQGLRPDSPREETTKEAHENLAVITRIAHEQIQLLGTESLDLTEAVKAQCAHHGIAYGPPYDLVRKAIESAIWQVQHR